MGWLVFAFVVLIIATNWSRRDWRDLSTVFGPLVVWVVLLFCGAYVVGCGLAAGLR